MEGRAMKQGNPRALAIGGLGLLALTASARAETFAPLTLSPMQAVSLDLGVKHVVGYFLEDGNHCRLILTIAEVGDKELTNISRVEFEVGAGGLARLETHPGGALFFACDNEAQHMRIRKDDGLSGAERVDRGGLG
jgi:hypothetical protein